MAATDTAAEKDGKEDTGAGAATGVDKVELARDTATIGDKASGLARVLVERCSGALADDIADLSLDALRDATPARDGGGRAYQVRVVDEAAHLRDVDAHRLLQAQLDGLGKQIDVYAPAARTQGDEGRESLIAAAGLLAGLPAVATAVAAVAGPVLSLVSKLSARDYQVAGREVDPAGIGFDVAVARALERKSFADEDVKVCVERLRPTPDSEILAATVQLALDAHERVRPVLTAAAAEAAAARAAADAALEEIKALDQQLLELAKLAAPAPGKARAGAAPAPADRDGALRARRAKLAADLPETLRRHDEQARRRDAGTALLAAAEALVTAALTPDARGLAPVMRAARVEDLVAPRAGAPPTHVLYARLTAGGIDQVLATRVGPDRWTATAGVSAEFALVTASGTVLWSGTRSVLQSTTMKPGDPGSLREFKPGYVAIERKRPT